MEYFSLWAKRSGTEPAVPPGCEATTPGTFLTTSREIELRPIMSFALGYLSSFHKRLWAATLLAATCLVTAISQTTMEARQDLTVETNAVAI